MTRRSTRAIIAHPLFSMVVALWCAALAGLASLLVPISRIEDMVVATGADRLVSVAAPPLGPTARVLIALVAALAGMGFALLFSMRLARTARRRAEAELSLDEAAVPVARASEPETAVRPLDLREALGVDPVVEQVQNVSQEQPAPRRRALAPQPDEAFFVPPEFAPLPAEPVIMAEPAPEPAPEPMPVAKPLPVIEPAPRDIVELAELVGRLERAMGRRRAARVAEAQPTPVAAAAAAEIRFEPVDEEEIEDPTAEIDYPSLLGLARPAGAVPGEPVVIFPGQRSAPAMAESAASPPPSSGSDEALRAALFAVQRARSAG